MKKTKRSKKSRSWVIKQHRDQFFKKSKVLGYRSRSSFKLIELNKKFKFLKTDTSFLDIGASPGGWCQVAKEIIQNGKILAVDVQEMKEIKSVKFIKCDFLDIKSTDLITNFFKSKIDVIASDMAANTTGNNSLDCIRTNLLCSEVIDFSRQVLKKNGTLISKLFMGEDFLEVKKIAKKYFQTVDFFKPESSRNESKETYIHCKKLKTL